MQNALAEIDTVDKELPKHYVQALPRKCYFKYRDKYGGKMYIPILIARGHPSRLSRKVFKRAQGAIDHAVAFHKRFAELKGMP